MLRSLLLSALLLALTTATASAAVRLTYDDGTDGAAARQVIYLLDDAMLVQTPEGDVFAFDSGDNVMRVIQHGEKKYIEITKEDMEKLGQTMDQTMSQMQEKMAEAMKNMTEEQKKAMKDAMGQHGMPGMPGMQEKVKAPDLEKMGQKQKINGFSCEGYKVVKEGEAEGEIWAASLDEVGLEKNDLAPVQAMTVFLAEGISQLLDQAQGADMLGFLDPTSERWVGFPVRMVDAEHGGKVQELQSVERGDHDVSSLLDTSGYEQQSMMPESMR